ncbi:MAG TPA: linear amide C-N hydrolase [Chitinophagaceae bacterium]|nr:linear amide C-N hydrolase [Chitinophagaceae bacterium]
MLKKLISLAPFLLLITAGHTCTTFFIHHNGKMVFGRNYDWMADAGMVCTNQRGLSKTSMKTEDGKTISWVSQYGSISFNQYGKEFPTGGMNEKGLVVELMWLDETIFPKPDERPAIGVLQWIQYQLDNCATIEEVIATDKTVRIVSKGTPLHYLVADAKGNAATIEFLNGKMVVHKGSELPMPVLTNDTYERSVKSNANGESAGDNSLERFATACKMIQEYKVHTQEKSLVDQSFAILNKVSQGDYTKWSIVYDITDKKIYFKTNKFQQVRSISFSSFNFSCDNVSKIADMNGPEQGDLSSYFVDYSSNTNNLIFEKTLEQSSPRITLKPEEKKAVITYPDAIRCK